VGRFQAGSLDVEERRSSRDTDDDALTNRGASTGLLSVAASRVFTAIYIRNY